VTQSLRLNRAFVEPLIGHTPGPWRVSKNGGYHIIRDGETQSICGFPANKSYNKANAPIIAAAPELREDWLEMRAALDDIAAAVGYTGSEATPRAIVEMITAAMRTSAERHRRLRELEPSTSCIGRCGVSYPTDFYDTARGIAADAAKLIPDYDTRKRETAATLVRLAERLADLTEQELSGPGPAPDRTQWTRTIGMALAMLFVMSAWHALDPEELVRKAAQHIRKAAGWPEGAS
jgi:hypothetical protein